MSEKGIAVRGLLIAAPRSGAGKTTVTLGLLVALRRRGVRVAAAKAGPDYIDPAFHAQATGRASLNLDSWAMGPSLLDELASAASQSAELLIVEAAMGLFDGVGGPVGRTGAAADLAARFGLPVLLVMDVSGQWQSAAAVARGFAGFHKDVRIGGVVLNRLASPRHLEGIAAALDQVGVPRMGAVFRDEGLVLPERHLGLIQACDHADLVERLERLGDMAERSLDLDAIVALAGQAPPAPARDEVAIGRISPPGQRIALASDAAFSFMYGHVMEGWRRAGAEIVLFSPLTDEPPPSDCDACWLPGGYPELHAPRLASASRFLEGLRGFAEKNRPVHGECGGYMVLGRMLETAAGERWAMAGLLSHSTSFAQPRMSLGYRSAVLLQDCALGRRGEPLRGHEFHYSRLVETGDDAHLAQIEDAAGRPLGLSGGGRGSVSGAYFHAIAMSPRQD